MQLSILHEDASDRIFDAVYNKIMSGESMIQKGISSGEFDLKRVLNAIQKNRCLSMADRDVGATALEQIIGGAIRDVIPIKQINNARRIFKLEPLDHDQLVNIRAAQQPPQLNHRPN